MARHVLNAGGGVGSSFVNPNFQMTNRFCRRPGMKFRWMLVAFVLFAAAAASAQEVDIPYQKFTLDNGLTVIVHEDHKAPIVAVNLWYHVGSKNERPGKTGFAHLFEHLMFGGSEHSKDRYIDTMERIGATDLNGTTNS